MNRIFLSLLHKYRAINDFRTYCYKPVKRVSLKDLDNIKKPVENKNESPPKLAQNLKKLIAASGPITLAKYMEQVLGNPDSGYYMVKDVFGKEGDFITSPEITQIFGELVGIWFITEWRKLGDVYPLQIVEFGPGRGTLAHDLIRVFYDLGIITRRVSYHIVETSKFLGKLQSLKLCHTSRSTDEDSKNVPYYRKGESIGGMEIYWYDSIDLVPNKFSLYLAHEFFDALPCHKFQKVDGNKWHEVLIDNDPADQNKFCFVTKGETPYLKLFLNQFEEDTRKHIEYPVQTQLIIEKLVKRMDKEGGICLIVDYGHEGEKEDTFRSFRKHKLHDPLIEPGTADLTTDVDFSFIKRNAERGNKIITFGPVNQGDFLRRMGGDLRLEILMQNAKLEQKEILKSGYEMLTSPEKGMCTRFKFFALYPQCVDELLEQYPPAGFTDET